LNQQAALRDFEEASRLDPANWELHRHYAMALFNDGRLEEALDHARKAWIIAPSASGVQWLLAELLSRTKRWNEALPLFQESCERENLQEGCARQAHTLLRMGREDEAREAARTGAARQDTPDGTDALARYHAAAGDTSEAVRMLRLHVDLASGGTPLRANFGLTPLRGNPEFDAVAAKQWEKAVPFWGEQCASTPGMKVCAIHAVALHLTGRETEAREVAATAATLEETSEGCQALAWFHGCARNRNEVIRYLKCRLQLGRPNPNLVLGEHVDFEWLRGDPEFDAVAAEISGGIKKKLT
jgi:tetratricopeptide (TPR) repeat protein